MTDASDVDRPLLSRRSLLKAGGATVAAGALGLAGFGLAAPASAALPSSQYFDLSQPSY